MSNGKKRDERHIRVRAVRREEPDLRKLSRALIDLALAQAQAEAAAEAEHQARTSEIVESETVEEDFPSAA